MTPDRDIEAILAQIYGGPKGREALDRIWPRIQKARHRPACKASCFSQGDMVLITYGDTLNLRGVAPLATWHRFAGQFLKGVVPTIHFLPFFPYSSDDGFSVKDFFRVDDQLGDWKDVARIREDFDLMIDLVINHFSAQSAWFQNYLDGRSGFADMAIEADPTADLSMVTRPRSLPLLTPFTRTNGKAVHLWTTFSADQIDFNYDSLDVLEKMIDVLLFYVDQDAGLLRLDAVAYLWKTIGTACIHLPQTHAMVRLLRKILDLVAPDVILITETNVPHEENVSYFGSGDDEAQMVYNFTLPPLLLYTFVRQDTRVLSRWARNLRLPSPSTAFFNFTASHDGIGVRPLEGILPAAEIDRLVDAVRTGGGLVSTRTNADGNPSPYELNITYVDAVLGDARSDDAQPFLASQAIQYSLPGVPATYIHSLLGSRNWHAGVHQTGRARTINREKLDLDRLMAELNDPTSFRARVFFPYLNLIRLWRQQPAFHPKAGFEILESHPGIFAIRRRAGGQTIHALTNVTSRAINVDARTLGIGLPAIDLVSGGLVEGAELNLNAYQFIWLDSR